MWLDNEAAEVSTCEWRRARCTHKCSECHRAISPREFYEYFTAVWDGQWCTIKTCRDCASLRAAVAEYVYYEEGGDCLSSSPPPGEIWNAAIERGLVSVARAA